LAKKARVYDGTAWQELASAQTDLTAYSTTAQMNTAIAANAGLNLITTVTLSGTSLTINNCFTSTYTNYLIVSNNTVASSTASDLNLQLRASGVTTTTGYVVSVLYNTNTGGPSRFYSTASAFIGGFGGNEAIGMTVNIYAPQLAQRTTLTSMSSGWGSGGSQHGSSFGLLTNTTQYDSLVISNANAMSGTLSIYGYKN
jgi:hypothetical protein